LKKISAVVPAYNEEKRIGDVINRTKKYVDEIIVVDDCSSDNTAPVARNSGAEIIPNDKNIGYIESIKRGFRKATGDIIVTMDADGEHNPEEIPDLLKPILSGKADVVLGKRIKISRISERFLNWLTNFRVKVEDSGTGFRAIKKNLALNLNLRGKCEFPQHSLPLLAFESTRSLLHRRL
jgi:glycosyltransferase involved in cell wall biosynthesis